MGFRKKKVEEPVEIQTPSEKDFLLALLEELKARKISRLSDLENQIANCKD